MIMIILRCDLIITTSINWWTADAGSVLEPWVEDNNARRPLGKAELPLLHLFFVLFCSSCFLYFFAPPAFCTFKPFCRYGWTVLIASQTDTVNIVYSTHPESIYVNRMFQTKLHLFFCWKTYCSLTGWVATNFIEVKVSKVSVQMVILRCIWINRAEQALKHFQLCSQAVKCKCISLYWGTSDRSAKKDGKNCQIFWHRFHGRADILKKDSVMKLKRRRRILLMQYVVTQ